MDDGYTAVGADPGAAGALGKFVLAQPPELLAHGFNFLFQGVQFFFRFHYRSFLSTIVFCKVDAKISDARF